MTEAEATLKEAAEQQDQNQPNSDAAAKKIADLEAQLKEKENRYLYLYAEFENYKKRAIKERSDLIKFGWEAAARELLQVVDNLERALDHMPPGSGKTLIDGLHMVLNQFKATLEKQGIQPISAVGTTFNPELHEAVGQESSHQASGIITKEHARGYTLHGRLLRPSRVIISNGQTATNTEEKSGTGS